MKRYENKNGNSNISSYEYGRDYIRVGFKNGAKYTYSYESAGKENIETMKVLADRGYGLNSFILKRARFAFVR